MSLCNSPKENIEDGEEKKGKKREKNCPERGATRDLCDSPGAEEKQKI